MRVATRELSRASTWGDRNRKGTRPCINAFGYVLHCSGCWFDIHIHNHLFKHGFGFTAQGINCGPCMLVCPMSYFIAPKCTNATLFVQMTYTDSTPKDSKSLWGKGLWCTKKVRSLYEMSKRTAIDTRLT